VAVLDWLVILVAQPIELEAEDTWRLLKPIGLGHRRDLTIVLPEVIYITFTLVLPRFIELLKLNYKDHYSGKGVDHFFSNLSRTCRHDLFYRSLEISCYYVIKFEFVFLTK